jgi:hypothetical protein
MQRIYIATEKNLKIVSLNGSMPNDSSITIKSYRDALEAVKIKRLSRGYFVQRSDKPLPIVLQIDSIQKTVFLQPKRTYSWLLNAKYLFGPNEPTDYYVGKRWIYPRKSFVTANDSIISGRRIALEERGGVYVTISPSIPIIDLKTDYGRYLTAGVVGIELGVDYFYKKNKFLSFNIGAATDALPVDHFGDFDEEANVLYTSMRNNMVFGSFDIGYGISFSRLFYYRNYFDSSYRRESISTTGLGLSFSAHYKLARNFKVGFLYQPNLISLNSSPTFSYQHYMAVQCTLDIPTKRNARERASMRIRQ